MTSKTLNNGVKMPLLGFGVFQSGGDTKQATRWALEAGYRHIDTAKAYHNEDAVGEAIRESGIRREDLFHHHQAVEPGYAGPQTTGEH